jgi:O-antigen ligase
MAATALPAGFWRRLVCASLLVLCFGAVFLATSETAKLALLAGLGAYGLARMSTALARYALSAAWLVACLGVVPLVLLTRSLDLHHADWLFRSAQIRVTQWSEIAQLAAQSPIFGVGANMTYVVQPIMHEGPAAPWINIPIPHPHNVYLQTWYELGLVGAALLATFGLLVLARIARLNSVQRPFVFALFAVAATQIGFSYSLWQIWFMCLFGFVAAMGATGINILENQ